MGPLPLIWSLTRGIRAFRRGLPHKTPGIFVAGTAAAKGAPAHHRRGRRLRRGPCRLRVSRQPEITGAIRLSVTAGPVCTLTLGDVDDIN